MAVAGTLEAMALAHEESRTPSLDEWIAEVGEERVAAIIREERRKCDAGEYPGFTDSASLLAYWRSGADRRSA